MSVSLNDLSTSKQDKLTAGTGISITDNTISATVDTSDCVKKDNGSLTVGSYAICCSGKSGASSAFIVNNGATTAGSNLKAGRLEVSTASSTGTKLTMSGVILSGTWRNVSGHSTYVSTNTATLFQRIS